MQMEQFGGELVRKSQRQHIGPRVQTIDNRQRHELVLLRDRANRGQFVVGRGQTTARYRLEDGLPAAIRIAPAPGFEDQSSLGRVRDQQTVGGVVDLTAESAAFVQMTEQLLGRLAVFRVLQTIQTLLH